MCARGVSRGGAGHSHVRGNIRLMPELLAPYLAYVRDPDNGYTSCELPIDDGLELSLR